MKLTESNYFSLEAQAAYWSVSQFKAFDKCEACGLATVMGDYEREETDSLLVGSYVDAYFANTMDEFVGEHSDVMFTKKGELYAKYNRANDIIHRIESEPVMMDYLTGDTQTIMTAKIFDVDWKIKADVLTDERIVDLKIVKDFESIYQNGFGRRSWIEYWGYDIQGAIYQRVVEENTGKRLPFYLVAATKEPVTDIAIIEIPQSVLDTAMGVVEAKIDRFDLIKNGEVDPIRCERCEYCKKTKHIEGPTVYESEVL